MEEEEEWDTGSPSSVPASQTTLMHRDSPPPPLTPLLLEEDGASDDPPSVPAVARYASPHPTPVILVDAEPPHQMVTIPTFVPAQTSIEEHIPHVVEGRHHPIYYDPTRQEYVPVSALHHLGVPKDGIVVVHRGHRAIDLVTGEVVMVPTGTHDEVSERLLEAYNASSEGEEWMWVRMYDPLTRTRVLPGAPIPKTLMVVLSERRPGG